MPVTPAGGGTPWAALFCFRSALPLLPTEQDCHDTSVGI